MNQTALEAALLPCPFCGDPMELQHTVIRHTEYVADCPISKMSMDSLYRDRWNRRSPAPAPAETEEDRALANFDKIKDSFFASHDVMLSAPAEGVAVRPLEWEEVHQRRSDEDPVTEVVGFEAPDGFGGFYTIVTNVADFTLSHGYDGKDTTHETERSAKAAAETHYQATIRSALLQSESVEKAGVVGWRDIENDPPPHDVPVLLWSPPSLGWPNGQIEARPFSTGRSGPGWSEYSQHSWATKWMPLPASPSPATGA